MTDVSGPVFILFLIVKQTQTTPLFIVNQTTGVFGSYLSLIVASCLPNALGGSLVIGYQLLSTLIEVKLRLVVTRFLYSEYWVIRIKRPPQRM